MPAIRLPQSHKEIRAAAKIITDTAYVDISANTSKVIARGYDADRRLVAGWLATIAPLGAIMQVDLVTQAELCLAASTEQLQALRPSQVANLIARKYWMRDC
jgi:hypothetical protein